MTQKTRKTRGQVLILTAFFIFVLFTLALAFFKLLPVELNSALKTRHSVSAQVAAASGVREAIVWLERQPPQRVLTQNILDLEFNDSLQANPLELTPRWSYRVRISPNPDGVFIYDILSEAVYDEKVVRQAHVTVTRENFARYALFIDRWPSSLIYSMTPEAVRGPFHTNDFFRLGVPDETFWDPGASFVSGNEAVMTRARSFSGGSLPFPGDGNAYYSGASPNQDGNLVPFDENGAIESRYEAIVEGGRSNLLVTDHIDLPYTSDQLRLSALSQGDGQPPMPQPSDIGFYVPGSDTEVTGGIFIKGNASLELKLSSEGNQIHEITQIIPEEAYSYEEEVTLQRPIYEDVLIEPPPGQTITVREYETREVPVMRQEITGYETVNRSRTVTVSLGFRDELVQVGGITQVQRVEITEQRVIQEEVEVPIIEEVPDTELRQVWTGNYIEIEATPQLVTQLVGYEPYTEMERRFITPEQYEADPTAYPDAVQVFLPGGPETGQVIEVTAEAGYSDGTVSAAKGQTVIKDYEGTVTVKDGSLNGVTFVDGNVTSIKGTSKGALTENALGQEVFTGRYVVANPDWNRKMNLTEDLLAYYDGGDSGKQEPGRPFTLKRGELSPTGEHALGLVAGEVRMNPARNNPLDIYGVILAGHGVLGSDGEPETDAQGRPRVEGGFGSEPDLLNPGYGLNNFRLFGGLIQANAYLWNEGGYGMTGDLIYDPAVADGLPRFPRSSQVVTLRYADLYVIE